MDDLSKYQFGGAGNSGYQFPVYDSMYVDDKRPEIAETLSNRYDANKAEYDALQRTMGAVQTLKGDQPVIQDLQNRVEGNLEGVVNSGRYEFGNMAVSDSVTDFMTDQNLISASKSWENRQKELEVIAQRRANGMQSYDFGQRPVIDPATGMAMRDPKTGEIITEHVTDSHVTSQQGVYQPLSENKLPAEEKARQLMQGIRDNPILLGRIASSNPELAFFLRSGKAVTGNKIAEVAEAVLPLYMDSSEGMQKMRALQQLTVSDATGGLHNSEEAADVLFQDLISAAAPQRGSDYQYIQNPYMTALAKQDPVVGTPVESRQSVDIAPEIENVNFDDYFDVNGDPTNVEPELISSAEDPFGGQTEGYTVAASTKRVRNELAEGKDLLNIRGNMEGKLQYLREEYENVIPRLPGQTDREYSEELWNGIVKNPAIQIGTVYAPRQGGMEGMLKVLGSSPNLQFIWTDNPTATPLTLAELDDNLDDSNNDLGQLFDADENWQKEIVAALKGGGSGAATEGDTEATVQINGLTTRGPLAGGVEATYTSSDGDVINLIIADKSKPMAQFKRLGAVSDLIAQGKPNASKSIDYPRPTKTGDPITDAKMPNGVTDVVYTYKVKRNSTHGNIESYVLIEYKNSRTQEIYRATKRPETLGATVQGILDNSAANGEELGLLFGGTKQTGDLTVTN